MVRYHTVGPLGYGPGPLLILNILNFNGPGSYLQSILLLEHRKHAPGAICILYMVLEQI